MSKRITFRYVPQTPYVPGQSFRSSYWVHDESGIEIHKGIDDSDGYPVIEWQIWTARMGAAIGQRPTLNEAKDRARQFITGEEPTL